MRSESIRAVCALYRRPRTLRPLYPTLLPVLFSRRRGISYIVTVAKDVGRGMKFNTPLPQPLPKECQKAAQICASKLFLRDVVVLKRIQSNHSLTAATMAWTGYAQIVIPAQWHL